MAYSKSPSISTYETKRQNFMFSPTNRLGNSPNKDARLVNVVVDPVQSPDGTNDRMYIKQRPGTTTVWSISEGVCRGCHYWVVAGVGFTISVAGTKVFSNDVYIGDVFNAVGEVGFAEYVFSSGETGLIMSDGLYIYNFVNVSSFVKITPSTATVWTLSTVTPLNTTVRSVIGNPFVYVSIVAGTTGAVQPTWPTTVGATVVDGTVTWRCTECSPPTGHIPNPVFLDGYLFLADDTSPKIFNSDLENIYAWNVGNYVSAEMYPDKIVALTKNNHYIYAVGTNSIEYYYDAAITNTSPLLRHDSAVQQFGTAAPATVVPTEAEVLMVGQTGNGGLTVWAIDGFKATEIGTPSIRATLTAYGPTISTATAYCSRVAGQKLYFICLSDRTLVYSLDTKVWVEWASSSDSSTPFQGTHGTDGPDGMPYVQGNTGTISTIDELAFSDSIAGSFRCEIVTPKYDFGTFNRKFASRFSLVGNKTPGVTTIEWSDDDYVTWSTPRPLDNLADFSSITQLGTFRQRAFRIKYTPTDTNPLRLEGFELDINKGGQ